jgi:hypothetical protein
MIVRDVDGKIHIISRKNSNNEKTYNQKIIKVRSEYMKYYKSVIIVSNQSNLSK